jgi:outer membrane protein TolC
VTARELRLALLELAAAHWRQRLRRLRELLATGEAHLVDVEEAEYHARRAELEVELFKEEHDIPEG